MSTHDQERLTKTIQLMLGKLVLRFGAWAAFCLVSWTAVAVLGYSDIKHDLKTVIEAQATLSVAVEHQTALQREQEARIAALELRARLVQR